MRFSALLLSSALCASSTLALPSVVKRQDTKVSGVTDATVLQFALVLEHLEDNFYAGALSKFTVNDFTSAGFAESVYYRIQNISSDESTHVATLTAGLKAAGANPVAACNYSFPYSTPAEFLALSHILEGVGVSAYSGAAQYIADADYLTLAATILTVEARHTGYVALQLGQLPFPAPFDTALDPMQVYTLASAFITSCPSTNEVLPFKAFPSLSLSPSGTLAPGATITLSANVSASSVYAAFYSGPNVVVSDALAVSNGAVSIQIPSTVYNGQTYVILTSESNSTAIADSNTLAGPAIIIIENANDAAIAKLDSAACGNSGSGTGSSTSVAAGSTSTGSTGSTASNTTGGSTSGTAAAVTAPSSTSNASGVTTQANSGAAFNTASTLVVAMLSAALCLF